MVKPLLLDLIEVIESILTLRMTVREIEGWEQNGGHKVIQNASYFHRVTG